MLTHFYLTHFKPIVPSIDTLLLQNIYFVAIATALTFVKLNKIFLQQITVYLFLLYHCMCSSFKWDKDKLEGYGRNIFRLESSAKLRHLSLSRVKMNSINWPAPNIWVFIAQLVEHCSANAEAMGSNPVEAQKFFSGLNLQLLKLRL